MNRIFLMLIVVSFLLNSCSRNKFKVDTSDIDVNLQIYRLDKELFECNADSLDQLIPQLRNRYGEFFETFNTKVIQICPSTDSAYQKMISGFITHKDMQVVYQKCKEKYPDMKEVVTQLTSGFEHYRYHFPDKEIPKIVICMTGFNYGIFTTENNIGIGLEMYLGRNCDFYQRLQGWSQYMQYKVDKERIASDCLYAWISGEFPNADTTETVLSNIIYQGKLLYMVNAMFPDIQDTILIGYTEEQLNWCEEYEAQMWSHLISDKLLFSTDQLTIRKLIMESPFTQIFTQKSPPRAGVWIGWRIVNSFMDNNPKTTLTELMLMSDYQQLIQKSKYKP